MPIIAIPTLTGYVEATPEFIDNNRKLVPSGGAGVTQTLQRLGSRWALNVALPPMREGADVRALTTAILRARSEGASYPWPQPGLVIGTPGAPVVNGAGQTGTVLLLRSGAASYQYRAGQAISILAGGRRYLHIVQADVTASGAGAVTLSIYPMLRVSPADGAAVEVAAPIIEGDITAENFAWTHDRDDWVSLAFRIEEVA